MAPISLVFEANILCVVTEELEVLGAVHRWERGSWEHYEKTAFKGVFLLRCSEYTCQQIFPALKAYI